MGDDVITVIITYPSRYKEIAQSHFEATVCQRQQWMMEAALWVKLLRNPLSARNPGFLRLF
jgi:hypothetical protein